MHSHFTPSVCLCCMCGCLFVLIRSRVVRCGMFSLRSEHFDWRDHLSDKDSESQRRERYMLSFRSVRLRVRLCRLSCGGALHAKVASRLCAPPRKERPLLLYGAKSNNRTVVKLWLVWRYGYFKLVSDCECTSCVIFQACVVACGRNSCWVVFGLSEHFV